MIFKQAWSGRNLNSRENEWFFASVPGNIQYDFGIYKDFGDVNYSDNYKKYLPYENDTWEYKTTLKYDKKEGERVFFVSGGIDYKYAISINGEPIYEYEGMFAPIDIDITDKLRGDGDVLTVKIYPHPKRADAPEGTRDEADISAKPPVCYGWDWNPRLLISGIWQDTYIETRDEYYIGDCEVLAKLSDDLSLGFVSFSYSCKKECSLVVFDAEGNSVYEGSEQNITVPSPKLWWCNGQGKPYLYRWRISNGKCEREGHIGFRTLRLVRNAGCDGPQEFPKGRYEIPITIELNGRHIFAKGSNWVNPDLFWGNITKSRYEELITLAKEANMNIFRMWGGAGIAKNDFYDICDRHGILVWQEFMLACNNYLGEEHYMQVLESEAIAIIKNLRSHPCLALWCGGNELFNNWSGMTDQSEPLRLLNKLCFEYDRARPFIATSPLFGMAHGGYTFFDPAQGGEVFHEFQRSKNTAYTEFGVPSIADAETLRRIIPEDELFPPKATKAWVAHHGFGAWGWNRWLCLDTLERYFGTATSIEELSANSNYLQCEGYRGAFEEARKQWPRCSMAINWCYNEPWLTAANNNLISYPCRPKPAYEYVKLALRDTLFSARIPKFVWKSGEKFESEIWLLNDSCEDVCSTVSVKITIGDTEIPLLDWSAKAKAGTHTQGPTVHAVLPNIENADSLILTLSADGKKDSTYRFIYRKSGAKISSREMNRG